MVTQGDVAALAGVSRRTVSNVINGYPHISPGVRERVTAAIEKLEYTPSFAARSLRSGKSGIIQLVIPELDVPYFSELGRHVIRAADDLGFKVLIRQTLGDPGAEDDAMQGPAAEFVEGTIISPIKASKRWPFRRSAGMPLVLIGEGGGASVFDHVGSDDTLAARDAVKHLLESGRRRIAFVGADPRQTLPMASIREAGYRQALTDAGIHVDETLIVPTQGYHRHDGKEAFETLFSLPSPPKAVFCATDLLGLGTMRAALEAGISVPEDLSVVGFDGIEEAEFFVPGLTTIVQDKEAIAFTAVEKLSLRISGDTSPPTHIVVPHYLAVRESSILVHS